MNGINKEMKMEMDFMAGINLYEEISNRIEDLQEKLDVVMEIKHIAEIVDDSPLLWAGKLDSTWDALEIDATNAENEFWAEVINLWDWVGSGIEEWESDSDYVSVPCGKEKFKAISYGFLETLFEELEGAELVEWHGIASFC